MYSFTESFQYCLLLEYYNSNYIAVILREEMSRNV